MIQAPPKKVVGPEGVDFDLKVFLGKSSLKFFPPDNTPRNPYFFSKNRKTKNFCSVPDTR
jgi:hypothetical protein